jgi:hypothetical protein
VPVAAPGQQCPATAAALTAGGLPGGACAGGPAHCQGSRFLDFCPAPAPLYDRVNARQDGQSEHLQCSKTGVKKIKKIKSELINRPSGNTPWRPRDFCRYVYIAFPKTGAQLCNGFKKLSSRLCRVVKAYSCGQTCALCAIPCAFLRTDLRLACKCLPHPCLTCGTSCFSTHSTHLSR